MAVLTVADNDGWLPAHSAARGGHVAVLQFIADSLGSLTLTQTAPQPKLADLADVASAYNQGEVLSFLKTQVILPTLLLPEP